ncbi:MAG: hypothetical protein ABSG79_26190 [Bryobacteraceae bacterium]
MARGIGLAVSLGSGVLFGLAPAFQAWRRDLIPGLYRGEAPAGKLGGRRVRDALVAAQLALAMVLLSGAGLMTNTLLRLLNVDLGFARSNVFAVPTVSLAKGRRKPHLQAGICFRRSVPTSRSRLSGQQSSERKRYGSAARI